MGEKQNQSFQPSFIPSLRVDFQWIGVTSDSGLLLVRELDERLGLSSLGAEHIRDGRQGKNTQLPLPLPAATVAVGPTGAKEMATMPSGFPKIRHSADRPGENLGSRWRAKVAPALVRDRSPEARGQQLLAKRR
jgi:hypothetical protein